MSDQANAVRPSGWVPSPAAGEFFRPGPAPGRGLQAPRGLVLWLTGLSGAGKSTLAEAAARGMGSTGRDVYVLDGDVLRQGLSRDLGFSGEDRRENVRRAGEVAWILADAGLWVIVALISPFAEDRDRVRNRFPPGRFAEVFVDCPLAVCERRDPKGLYHRARSGDMPLFTGIGSPYEPPERAELVLKTEERSVAECSFALERLAESMWAALPGPTGRSR